MKTRISNIYHVAAREVNQVLASKGFLVMMFFPILIMLFIVGSGYLAERFTRYGESVRSDQVKIGVIGLEPGLRETWLKNLEQHKLSDGRILFNVQPFDAVGFPQETLVESLKKQVNEKKLDGYVVIDGDILTTGVGNFYTRKEFEIQLPDKLRDTLRDAVRDKRLESEGLDPERVRHLNRGITWNEFEITKDTGGDGGDFQQRKNFQSMIMQGMVAVMLMFMLVYGSAEAVMKGVVAEKQTRMVEVLLSSLSPFEIFAGKVAGFYLIGLVQFAIWIALGVVISQYKGVSLTDYLPVSYFVHYLLFLTTGYLFMASIMAALGAVVGNEQETQIFAVLISLILVFPMFLLVPVVNNPNWWLVRLLCYVPIFSPGLMALRMLSTTIAWWESLLVAANSIFFAILGIWFASRIFQVGILLSGKRLTIREIFKWCFYREKQTVISQTTMN